MRRVIPTLLGLTVTAGFYLLLIDTTDSPELYAGAGVVLLAMIAFELSRKQGLTEASTPLRWVLRGWRAVARVPVHIALVCREAVAQLIAREPVRGELRAVRFKGGHGSRDVGRQALAEMIGSLAPNTIVLGVDADRELLLVHQLRRQGGRDELDVLRLG
jgi:multisubunit Na+/H+ antiporter MnhE subunit